VVFEDGFTKSSPRRVLPQLVWIGVWCRLPSGNSFWDPLEESDLAALESDLLALAERHSHGWAAYVRCLHTPGIREYYFYASPQAELELAHTELAKRHPRYRIEIERTNDPQWTHYTGWLTEPREKLSQ
jgi:hypothetical protein